MTATVEGRSSWRTVKARLQWWCRQGLCPRLCRRVGRAPSSESCLLLTLSRRTPMANTTVRGAQAIHGQNPQVALFSIETRGAQNAYSS
jgi:hypothetical protein